MDNITQKYLMTTLNGSLILGPTKRWHRVPLLLITDLYLLLSPNTHNVAPKNSSLFGLIQPSLHFYSKREISIIDALWFKRLVKSFDKEETNRSNRKFFSLECPVSAEALSRDGLRHDERRTHHTDHTWTTGLRRKSMVWSLQSLAAKYAYQQQ